MSYIIAAIVAAVCIVLVFLAYKKYYHPSSESFSGAFDPSTRYGVAGIGPSYDGTDECPNCQ
jgi:hypothetical protein